MDDSYREPIEDAERPFLAELGREIKLMRHEAGISQLNLAERVQLSERHVQRLEAGHRRTRRSTLVRLVDVLLEDEPDDVRAHVVDELCATAGPSLADEGRWGDRRIRRYAKRQRRREAIRAEVDRLVLERLKDNAERAEGYRSRGW